MRRSATTRAYNDTEMNLVACDAQLVATSRRADRLLGPLQGLVVDG